VNRGVTWFEDGKDRQVLAAIRNKLYCLDPGRGKLVRGFGDNGVVDLSAQLDRDMTGLNDSGAACFWQSPAAPS